jgi:hypothetical protein
LENPQRQETPPHTQISILISASLTPINVVAFLTKLFTMALLMSLDIM